MKKRVHIYYSGVVQGVGFRFTVEDIARQSDITGWVKNLPDGKVEVLAEGEERLLIRFLDKIKNGPLKHYIRNIETAYSEATGEFKGFGIRFW